MRPAHAHSLAPLDPAGARLERSGKKRQQRRLARAVGADERERLRVVDLQLGRLERGPLAEAAACAARCEERLARAHRL